MSDREFIPKLWAKKILEVLDYKHIEILYKSGQLSSLDAMYFSRTNKLKLELDIFVQSCIDEINKENPNCEIEMVKLCTTQPAPGECSCCFEEKDVFSAYIITK